MATSIFLQVILGMVFLFLAFVCFTLPGSLILRKFLPDLDDLEKLTLYSVFGLVIFNK